MKFNNATKYDSTGSGRIVSKFKMFTFLKTFVLFIVGRIDQNNVRQKKI